MSEFSTGLIIALILIYLAMVAQFRSFVDPLVILFTVPLGFIGVALALWMTGIALSIPVFMGVIMMTGTVVEYTIIMVEFANKQLREDGKITTRDAIVRAARTRLKPILMASLTTVLAIFPMALGFGGGDANVPLAVTIIGGVIGAVVLSMFVTPGLYVLLKRRPQVVSGDGLSTS
jgi:multidrug efflux pump subunit AcrB